MSDAVQVDPSEQNSNYHLGLERPDTGEKLGLILCNAGGEPSALGIQETPTPATTLQISQGAASGYSDMVYPNTPIPQTQWNGGRGQEDLDTDSSRYADGQQVDTTLGDILLGPEVTTAPGFSGTITAGANRDDTYCRFASARTRLACRVQLLAPQKSLYATVRIASFQDSVNEVASLYTDVGGVPGAEIVSNTQPIPAAPTTNPVDITFDLSGNFSAGTYWLVLNNAVGNYADIVSSVMDLLAGNQVKAYNPSTGLWADYPSLVEFHYALSPNPPGSALFFEYKGALYAVTTPDQNAPSRLYLNGVQGLFATTQGAGNNNPVLLSVNKDFWVSDDFNGGWLKITKGTGYRQRPRAHAITDSWVDGGNGDCRITTDTPWSVVPRAKDTEFAIVGVNKWEEVTGTGFTGKVTAVCVADGTVYFAQGPDLPVRKFRAYNNGGTWTREFADDGTNKADQLVLIPDTAGKRKIWKGLEATATVACADLQSNWASALSFGAEIPCGSSDSPITKIVPYDNPQAPYVLKEDSFGSVSGNGQTSPPYVYAEVPLGEMKAVRSEMNGVAATQHGVLLLFSLLDGLEQYYDQTLRDMGPNRGEGLPADRAGTVVDLVSYPGRAYLAIDAGASGYSSILAYNEMGFCELYRGAAGKRIRSLHVQALPGCAYQRLWFSMDNGLYWIPVAPNPRKAAGYRFTTFGQLVSSWIYDSKKDVAKYWDSITLFTEGCTESGMQVIVEYQTDTDTAWHLAETPIVQSPKQQIALSTNYDVTGFRLRYRLSLYSNDATKSPRVKALVLNAVERVPTKSGIAVTFLVDDGQENLFKAPITATAAARVAQLKDWADSRVVAAPLILHYCHPYFEGRRVFLERPTITPVVLDEQQHKIRLIGRLTLTEK